MADTPALPSKGNAEPHAVDDMAVRGVENCLRVHAHWERSLYTSWTPKGHAALRVQHGMPMGALYSGAPTVLPKGRSCVCDPPVKGGMRVWTSLINKSFVATVAHVDSVVSADDEGGRV